MCLSKPKATAVTAPPAPASPADTVKSPEDTNSQDASLKAKRKGRSSLKIPLDAGVGSSSAGLNIPQV